MSTEPLIQEIVAAAGALVDAVTFDDSGFMGKGGNGGLVSRETIRRSDELRLLLSTWKQRGAA